MTSNPAKAPVRISFMAKLHHPTRTVPLPRRHADTRARRLSAVTASLRSAFGVGAILVARGQPPLNEVGRDIGISWQDVIDALAVDGFRESVGVGRRARDGT